MFEAWNTAYNVGFASHFRFTRGTVNDCQEIAARSGFDPQNVLLAFYHDRPAGLVRVACQGRCGEPELPAVSPSQRGRGLGRALFRWALQRLGTMGCDQFRLIVDADGPIAPRLYATEGFTTTSVQKIWERAM